MATESERIARIEGAYEHLATRADVETVKTDVHDVKAMVQTAKTELQIEIQSVKSEVQTVKSELQTEIQSVRSEVQAVKSELQTEIQSVRSELKSDYAAMQSDIAGIRSELRWFRWIIGIGVVGILLPLLQRLFESLP